MRQINISDATVEWLDRHVSKFPGMARHVPRDLNTARGLFLSESVEIPLTKVTVPTDQGHIVMQAPGSLDRQTLNLLIQTVILFEDRTYGFGGLAPGSDEKAVGNAPHRWIEIRFVPA